MKRIMYFDKYVPLNPNIGTIAVTLVDHNLLQETTIPITIDRYIIDNVEFLLQREPTMRLVFQHISPQYGTRLSRLDLAKVPQSREHLMVFTWSPEEIRIYFGVKGRGAPIQGDYVKV